LKSLAISPSVIPSAGECLLQRAAAFFNPVRSASLRFRLAGIRNKKLVRIAGNRRCSRPFVFGFRGERSAFPRHPIDGRGALHVAGDQSVSQAGAEAAKIPEKDVTSSHAR